MKTFRQFLLEAKQINESVADIPTDLKEVINKHWEDGLKDFLNRVYTNTYRDLNDLEMGKDVFTKTSKIKESDLNDVVKDKDKILIINLFKNGVDKGIVYLSAYSTSYEIGGKYSEAFLVKDKYYRLSGRPRNVALVLNSEGVTYKAWIIDLSKAKNTQELRKQRQEIQQGIIQRYSGILSPTDKSGYMIDRSKYKEMLKQLKRAGNDYIDRIAKISAEYFDITKNLQKKDPDRYSTEMFRVRDVAKLMQSALNASVDGILETNQSINKKIDEFQKGVNKLKELL